MVKLGPRPHDFDEGYATSTPTWQNKWKDLPNGETITYSGKKFTKGAENADERLMRILCLARRHNSAMQAATVAAREERERIHGKKERVRRTDEEIDASMDVKYVRSSKVFKAFQALKFNKTLVYDQLEFTKGTPKHEEQLMHRIWKKHTDNAARPKASERLKAVVEASKTEDDVVDALKANGVDSAATSVIESIDNDDKGIGTKVGGKLASDDGSVDDEDEEDGSVHSSGVESAKEESFTSSRFSEDDSVDSWHSSILDGSSEEEASDSSISSFDASDDDSSFV